MQRRFGGHCILVLEERKVLATCWSVGAKCCRGKKGRGLSIRSELQPAVGADSSESTIPIKEVVGDASFKKEAMDVDIESSPKLDYGNEGGGDDSDQEKGDDKDSELGSVLKFEEVIREAELRKAILLSDMLEAAKTVGI